MSEIGLIDYGSGNLQSVGKALEEVGARVRLITSPEALKDVSAMVLPGVGSFGDCVRNLRERGLWEPVRTWLAEGRPFLGICLGYQLLFESSEESPGVEGLGFLRGKVVRFKREPGLKIPHMCWNALALSDPSQATWEGLPADPYVFFVHSFFPAPEAPEIISSRCTYGTQTFAASVATGNLHACQFHPEKSQDIGLRMLRNFTHSLV